MFNNNREIVTTDITETQLNYLTNVSSDIQTQLSNKQNIVANVNDTKIGYLSNVTGDIQGQFTNINSTLSNKQNVVSGVNDTKIGYLANVTSDIQTQIDNKQDIVAGVSNTEIGYLANVTSDIQTQIDNKQDIVAGVSNTEIGYLSSVTSDIQGQINNITDNSISYINDMVFPTNSNNIISTKNDESPATATFDQNNRTVTFVDPNTIAFPTSLYSSVDMTLEWTCIFKINASNSTGGVYDFKHIYLGINCFDNLFTNNIYSTLPLAQYTFNYAYSEQKYRFRINNSINDDQNLTQSVQNALYNTDIFIILKKNANNTITIRVYDDSYNINNNFTYTTTPAVNVDPTTYPYSLCIGCGFNDMVLYGMLISQGNDTITPQSFDNLLSPTPYMDAKLLTNDKLLMLDTNRKLITNDININNLTYLDATSSIQTQLDNINTNKQDLIIGGATSIVTNNLTINRVLESNSAGKIIASAITNTELSYLDNATSNIQTQLNNINSNKQDIITGAASTIVTNNLTAEQVLISSGTGKIATSNINEIQLQHLEGLSNTGILTGDKIIVSNGSGKLSVSTIDVNNLNTLSSNVQTQIDNIDTTLLNKQDKVTNVNDTKIGYLANVTNDIQGQIYDNTNENINYQNKLLKPNIHHTIATSDTRATPATFEYINNTFSAQDVNLLAYNHNKYSHVDMTQDWTCIFKLNASNSSIGITDNKYIHITLNNFDTSFGLNNISVSDLAKYTFSVNINESWFKINVDGNRVDPDSDNSVGFTSVMNSFFGSDIFIYLKHTTSNDSITYRMYNSSYVQQYERITTTILYGNNIDSTTYPYTIGIGSGYNDMIVYGMLIDSGLDTITPIMFDNLLLSNPYVDANLITNNKLLYFNNNRIIQTKDDIDITKLQYVNNVVSDIQTQFNSLVKTTNNYDIPITPANIATVQFFNSGDGIAPTPANYILTTGERDCFALKSAIGYDWSGNWRFVIKTMFTESPGSIILNFDIDSTTDTWTLYGGSVAAENRIILSPTSATGNVNSSVSSSAGIPNDFWQTNTPCYVQITKTSSSTYSFKIFDYTYTEFYDNTITYTGLTHTNDLILTWYMNAAVFTMLKLVGEEGTPTLTAQQLMESSYSPLQVNSNNLTSNTALVYDGSGYISSSTTSTTALSYINNVSSDIQTQLNNKQNIVANVSDTEIGYLNGLTSNIQTQINNKQNIIANVSDTEIGYLDGVTSNIQTQINNKQNSITGAASTILSNDLITNRALLSDGSGKVAVSSVTNTELGYLSGVTSNIQTQLDAAGQTISGAATTVISNDLTANRAMVSDSNGKVAISNVTDAELGYLGGVTSDIQTQIDNKQNSITGAASTIISNDLTVDRALLSDGSGKVNVSSVTNTELDYLSGVTSNIQTQLNNKLKLSTRNLIDITPSNILIEHYEDSPDGLPVFNNGVLELGDWDVWGISSTLVNYDWGNNNWRIIFKVMVIDATARGITLGLNNSTSSSSWLTGGGIVGIGQLEFKTTETVGKNGWVSTNSTALGNDFWQTSTPSYFQMTKISNTSFTVYIYDSTFTEIYNTTITTPNIDFLNDIVFLFYNNGASINLLNLLLEEDTTITPLTLESLLTMSFDNLLFLNDDNVIKLESVSNKLNYINNVTSDIQTQIDNISSKGVDTNKSIIINKDNIAITYQKSMSDDLYPYFDDNVLKCYANGKAWGLYANKSNLDLTQEWKILYKLYVHEFDNDDHFVLHFDNNTYDTGWISTDSVLGGEFNTRYLFLKKDPILVTSDMTLSSTTGVNTASVYVNNITLYFEISRLSNGHTLLNIYNDTQVIVYTVTIETIIPYTTNMVFDMYNNRIIVDLLGLMTDQTSSITINDLENAISFNKYIKTLINNSYISSHRAYYQQLIDYYVSIKDDGNFYLTGNILRNTPNVVHFGISPGNMGNAGTGDPRQLYPYVPYFTGDSSYTTTHDGVTWIKPPIAATNSAPNGLAYNRQSLLIEGIDLSLYTKYGFTLCFYMTNFRYDTTNINLLTPHMFSMFMDNPALSQYLRYRHIFPENQYTLKVTTVPDGNVTSSPAEPRYAWDDTSHFKYADTEYTGGTTGILRSAPDDIWFVALTFTHGVSSDDFEPNAPPDNKYMQLHYKRTSNNFVNKSKIFQTTSYSAPANWTGETDHSRIFQNNAMFIFGHCGQSDTFPYTTVNSTNWQNKTIDTEFGTTLGPKCEQSEFVIFNKALSDNEINHLSNLTPHQFNSLLS
jgi:hypothetical protein